MVGWAKIVALVRKWLVVNMEIVLILLTVVNVKRVGKVYYVINHYASKYPQHAQWSIYKTRKPALRVFLAPPEGLTKFLSSLYHA